MQMLGMILVTGDNSTRVIPPLNGSGIVEETEGTRTPEDQLLEQVALNPHGEDG